MKFTLENILLIGSVLLIISVIAGKTSSRFGVPVIILFVIIGMLAGTEGIGKIEFNDPAVAKFIGFIALNFILFSGGLDTKREEIRPVLWQSITLSTAGVFITALLVGIFVGTVTDLTLLEGLLLGSIVSSTDAAAVFSILRSQNIKLKKTTRATLELESGSNDPMAYFLTIAFIALIINEEKSAWSIVPLFLKQMIIGAAAGLFFGKLGKEVINRIKLDFEGLYPVLVIALMFFTSSLTDFLGGNAFLAIYVAAVYLGSQNLIHKQTIMKVFDGLAWLMQIILFLTLGLLVFPSHILPVIGTGLLVSVFLILVARPAGVFAALSLFRVKKSDMAFISWVGLRGAVPIVFATYPLLAGVKGSGMIFNIVFFISLTSVLIQGTTLGFFARLFRVVSSRNDKGLTDIELSDTTKTKLKEITLKPDCFIIGKKIVDIGFPPTARIAIIKRDGQYIIPEGSTVIRNGDRLVVIAENESSLDMVRNCILKNSEVPE